MEPYLPKSSRAPMMFLLVCMGAALLMLLFPDIRKEAFTLLSMVVGAGLTRVKKDTGALDEPKN